jgi:hypothetical protein
MNNKADKKNWFDIKVLIATLGFLFTMWLWNSFSKDLAKETLAQYQSVNTSVPNPTLSASVTSNVQPTPFTRLLMGGAAPQVYQTGNSSSQPITQTNSSK